MRNKKIISVGEIFLLVSLSFAVSVLMSENFVSAQIPSAPFEQGLEASIARAKALTPPFRPTAFRNGIPLGPNGELLTPAVTPIKTSLPGSVAEKASEIAGHPVGAFDMFGGAPIDPSTPVIFDASKGYYVPYEGAADGIAKTNAGDVVTSGGGGSFLGSGQGTLGGLFGGNFFGPGSEVAGGSSIAGIAGALTTGLIWGAAVYGATYFIAKAFGQTKKQAQSIALGLGAGMFTWDFLYYWGANNGVIPYLTTGTASFVWGIGIAAAVIILTYKKEKTEIVTFECQPWQPPIGGQNCAKCNEDPLVPCSEYRCKSLGQACQIVNPGTEDELCVWVHKEDVKAPVITPWEDALKPEKLKYVRDGLGWRITQDGAPGGCLEPFTRLEFGVKTDEPSQCRLDLGLKDKYDGMTFLFGETELYSQEHAQTRFRIPNPFAPEEDGEVPPIHNDGVFTMYVRCRDANGNGGDSAPLPLKFCVQKGPDTKPPVIEGFLIEDNSPVRFEVDSLKQEVYTNEPAECKWSKTDKEFDLMENKMSCSTNSLQFNGNLQYVCSGTLTGIKDREDNTFWFRCKDKPLAANQNDRNVMQVGVKNTLRGTEPLVIQKIGPSGEIRGATSIVTLNLTVTTGFGADEGKSTCYYKFEESGQFNVQMLGTGTTMHEQPVSLSGGDYTAYFKCIDGGGNAAQNQTSFKVIVDTLPPLISRVYKNGANLQIITSEEAKCVYSLNSCSYEFGSGLPLNYDSVGGSVRKDRHAIAWDKEKTYYVKCEDLQGKRVAPDKCSIVVKGTEF